MRKRCYLIQCWSSQIHTISSKANWYRLLAFECRILPWNKTRPNLQVTSKTTQSPLSHHWLQRNPEVPPKFPGLSHYIVLNILKFVWRKNAQPKSKGYDTGILASNGSPFRWLLAVKEIHWPVENWSHPKLYQHAVSLLSPDHQFDPSHIRGRLYSNFVEFQPTAPPQEWHAMCRVARRYDLRFLQAERSNTIPPSQF